MLSKNLRKKYMKNMSNIKGIKTIRRTIEPKIEKKVHLHQK